MKTFRYRIALLTILLMGMGAGVQAQDDERALGAATDTICRLWGVTKKQYVYRIVEKVFEDHPTASFATRIAKSFYSYNENGETHVRDFHIMDTVAAFRYIRRSIELDPKYAPAYVLASDILDYARQRDVAMQWLENGIEQNPTDSSLYIASAMLLAYTDADAAVAKLKVLKERDPNFPVELQLGRLYKELWNRGGVMPFNEMADAYGKANMADMTQGDLEAYAFALRAIGQVDKLTEVSRHGLGLHPKSIVLNQCYFYGLLGMCNNGSGNWTEAITAANNYFTVADSSYVSALDYLRYGEALNGNKQFDQAIAVYEKVINMPKATENNIRTAYNHISTTMQDRVNGYLKSGDYQTAVDIYSKYVEHCRSLEKLDASILSVYAGIYSSWASKQTGEEQEATYMKADNVYKEMGEKFPEFDDIAEFNRLQIRTTLDPQCEKAISIPFAEKLIPIILAKGDLTAGRKSRLSAAYWTLCYYYAVKSVNRNLAMEYANKILAINPEHSSAQKIIEIYGKKR